MPPRPSQSGQDHNPSEERAAIDRLLEAAKNLTNAQERDVERLRAAGLDTRSAEGLLDAYRASVRIASDRRRELEMELARRTSS